MSLLYSSFVSYPTPRNLNFLWTFGAILSFFLIIQIVTGVILVMHYTPSVDLAFNSVELTMRDVNYGWLLRYLHANGCVDVLPRRLYPHVSRDVLRLVQGAARDGMDDRRRHLPADDRDRVHGLCAAVGADELLGGAVITNFFSAFPIVGDAVSASWLLRRLCGR